MSEQVTTLLSSEWLSTEETMDVLGKAQRTIQEFAQRKILRFKIVRSPGKRPERFYSAADVQTLKDGEVAPRPLAQRPTVPQRVTPQGGAAVPTSLVHSLEQFLAKQDRASDAALALERERWELERKERARQLLRQKSWLTPSECSRLEGLPSKTIVELAEQGKIAAMLCGKNWRIRRASLEAYAG